MINPLNNKGNTMRYVFGSTAAAAFLALCTVGSAAMAQEEGTQGKGERPSYNYLHLGYLMTDYNQGTHESFLPINDYGSGFLLEGSMAVNDRFHAFLGLTEDQHSGEFDFTYKTTELGMGGNWATSNHSDVFVRAAVVFARLDSRDSAIPDTEANGLRLDLGVRGDFGRWELDSALRYRDVESLVNELSFALDTRYNFKRWLGVHVGAELGRVTTYNVGLRLNFQ
jgi:hypothetical protein